MKHERSPSAAEINAHDSPDEQVACRNFHDKTLTEAEAMFRENFLYYQEDLMFVGPVAFRFYVTAAIRYLNSREATGDSDAVSCLVGLLKWRLEFQAAEMVPCAAALADLCRYLVEKYDSFDLTPEICGDLRPQLLSLEQGFLRIVQP